MNTDIQAETCSSRQAQSHIRFTKRTRDNYGDCIYYYNRREAALLICIYKSVGKESNIQCNLLAYFTALARSIHL